MFVEDTDIDLTKAEQVSLAGFFSFTSLELFNSKLKRTLIKEGNLDAKVRGIFHEASRRDPGVPLLDYVDAAIVEAKFRSRNNLIEQDKELQPLYGRWNSASDELQALGCRKEYVEFLRDYFLKDNALYRVTTTCCLVAAAGILVSGVSMRVGTPSALALDIQPEFSSSEPLTADMHRRAAAFLGSGSLNCYTD